MRTNCMVYVVCKMTGRYQDEMVARALEEKAALEKHGLIVHHPIIEEGVAPIHRKLKDRSEVEMEDIWIKDRAAIRKAHVIIDTAATVHSVGARRETGKSRYGQWKPLVTVWGKARPPFIARKEDDACVKTIEEAGRVVARRWGSRAKRMKWRAPIWARHFLTQNLEKIREFFR